MSNFVSLFITTNHIFIGVVYIILGWIGGSFGFGLSIIIRLELSLPGLIVASTVQYNSIITFHGIFMIFFMIMPLLIGGFGNILIPLMLSSSDMIFPRLNALSLWLIIDSLFFMYLAMLLDGGVNAGWTFYVPLSIMNYYSVDLMLFSLHVAGLSSLLGSINFIITLLKACNLSILYSSLFLPLFPWSIFFTSLLLILSLPVLAGSITMIIFDRHFNCSFFDPVRGGSLILFQHLFWFFGHPEAHILILPAFGLISDILSKFSQCVIFGRDSMLIALLVIGFLGCIVWGHHMFMVGFDIDTRAYYTSVTSIIAIPTGMKVFNWMATAWSGIGFLSSAMLWVYGFLFHFSFGGFTGLILANIIIDVVLHDSYFVVSHFHYVLSLGAVYTIFAAFFNYWIIFSSYYWFYDFLGRIHFISFFISSNLVFFSMHSLGLYGFPRRIFDYYIYFFKFNWLNAFGLVGIFISFSFFIFNCLFSFKLICSYNYYFTSTFPSLIITKSIQCYYLLSISTYLFTTLSYYYYFISAYLLPLCLFNLVSSNLSKFCTIYRFYVLLSYYIIISSSYIIVSFLCYWSITFAYFRLNFVIKLIISSCLFSLLRVKLS